MLTDDLSPALLRSGEAVYLTVFGGSMYPFVKNGDEVRIEPVGAGGIKIGDIAVVYRKTMDSPELLIHRVVEVKGRGADRVYFTKGDGHKDGRLDGPIDTGSVIGRVTRIKSKGVVIDLETPLWRHLNFYMGSLSLRQPKIFACLSACINIVLERKLFFAKIRKRLKNGDPVLHNTEDLVLICARKDLSGELIVKAKELIREGINWDRFRDLAFKSRASTLIYSSLRSLSPTAGIPRHVLDKLKDAYLYTLGSAYCQHQDTADLLKLLSEKDIPAIPVKGTFLSKRIYGNVESRGENTDIDIFIRWSDRERLHKVLTENGFIFSPSEEMKAWLWQENCAGPGSRLVDVLYDIWLRGIFKEAIAGLWDGAKRVTDESGFEYYKFKEEDLLIYMSQCLITSDDGYKCLKYICDVNEFLNVHSRELNWENVINKAKSWRLKSSLYTALSLRGDLFGHDIPPSAMNSIKPGLFKRRFIKTFFNRKVLLKENFRRRLLDNFLSYAFFELIEATRAAEYWRVVKRNLMPPKEVLLSNKNYGSKPFYAGYVLRLLRGLSRLLPSRRA